jgi:DNA-binding transcriptional LysR family regulator
MELKHLASFVSVAEQLSFVRAAHTLHISQPALTAQIQKLEEHIGVQLFVRNRRSVKLSDAGTVFVVEARATLARAKKAAERVRRTARGEIGRLRIGFVSSAALTIVPRIVVEFRKYNPGVALRLISLRTTSQVKKLLDKSIDIGFLRLPLSNKQLNHTVIHQEQFVAVMPRGHRLARTNQIHVSQLRAEPFVAVCSPLGTRLLRCGCADVCSGRV